MISLIPKLKNGSYILQEAIVQHSAMEKLNGEAINTLRIVTIYNQGNPYVLSALLRVGTKATGNVDNWAVGGLAVEIKKDGHLHQFGIYKPGHGLKEKIHPDSKVCFQDFTIPMYEEILEAACEAHKFFYGLGAIGWDVAISEEGPVFVEGNDNFEITILQAACCRGLRKEWQQACK